MIGDPRLKEFARRGPVLIVDSMIRFHTADENSATQMAQVMASLRELATAGASIVILHHKSKSETSSYRGSSDIVAGADGAFSLAKREGMLELRTIKNRFAAETTIRAQPDFVVGTFVPLNSPDLECGSAVDRLADIIRSSPGLTQNEIIKQGGIQRRRAIELLHRYNASKWNRQEGANCSLRYFPIQVVPEEIGVDPCQNHQAGGSESSSRIDAKRREPLGITRVVPVLPPFRGGNREQLEYFGT